MPVFDIYSLYYRLTYRREALHSRSRHRRRHTVQNTLKDSEKEEIKISINIIYKGDTSTICIVYLPNVLAAHGSFFFRSKHCYTGYNRENF